MKKVLGLAKIKDHEAELMTLIRRLVQTQETFATKLAALAMIPVCYPHFSAAVQSELAT